MNKKRSERPLVAELALLDARLRDAVKSLRATRARIHVRRAPPDAGYDEAPVGYLVVDDGGRILECNRALSLMTGRPRRLIESSPLHSLAWSRLDRDKVHRHLSRCRQEAVERDCISTELVLRARSRSVPVQLLSKPSSRHAATGGPGPIYRTVVLDRTEHEQTERRLRETERRLSLASEASGAAIFEHELPFQGWFEMSERLAAILGCAEELPAPERFLPYLRRRLHADDWSQLERIYRELTDGRRSSYALEARVRRPEGHFRWVKVWARAEVKPPAAPSGESRRADGKQSVVGVVQDVTAERRRTAELERRTRQLGRLTAELHDVEERERRQIASDLHDDLAQLIVATRMKLSSIIDDPQAEPVRDAVQESIGLLERAEESTRSMIAHVSPPVLDELGLGPALSWLARELKAQFGLHVEVLGKIAPRIDRQRRSMLFRSMRELLINVAKHAGTDHASIEFSTSSTGAMCFTVSDGGCGFDPKTLGEETSSGFGLFSIQERIEWAGGTLDVNSAPGRGTRVSLLLPWKEESDADAGAASAPVESLGAVPVPATEPGRIRVLIVDDHAMIRGALACTLSERDEIVVIGEAGDGESGVALARHLEPDVVLMDVTMQGCGGVEATRRITRLRPGTCVIGLSMHEDPDMERAMLEAGARGYLRKTEAPHRLLEAIRAIARAEPGAGRQSSSVEAPPDRPSRPR